MTMERRSLVDGEVAAERVEFGNPTGMAGSVPGEMELPAQRGGRPTGRPPKVSCERDGEAYESVVLALQPPKPAA